MEATKQIFDRFLKWEYSGLSILLVVTAILHFLIINNPRDFIFDEIHYVPDAIAYIMHGNGTVRIEHPPLAKLFITLGMEIFGENSTFGWRFFSVVFGTISVALFYLICRQLFSSRNLCFLAAFLFAFENMSFTQASVAMLDIFSLTFMLLSFWLYLRGNFFASGVSIGLAALCKITGAFAIPIILLYWIFTRAKSLKRSLLTIVVAVASFLALRPLFDYCIWHEFLNPIGQTIDMLSKSGEYTFAQSTPLQLETLSRSWDWIIHPTTLTYYEHPHYISMVSYSLWALIIPVVGYMIWRTVRRSNAARFALIWFIVTYFFWVFLNLLTDRITYNFYFYFSIGALCIGIALMLSEIRSVAERSDRHIVRLLGQTVIPAYLLAHLVSFAILIPVSYWWKVPVCLLMYAFARYIMDNDTRLGDVDNGENNREATTKSPLLNH